MKWREYFDLCGNKYRITNFLCHHNIIPREKKCGNCNKHCTLDVDRFIFRCGNDRFITNANGLEERVTCTYICDALMGTWFEHIKLSVVDMCALLGYFLIIDFPRQDFISSQLRLSSGSYIRHVDHCRKVLLYWVMKNSKRIGGNGSTVEIYRGQNSIAGCVLDKLFFFGGYDRKSKEMFMIPVSTNNYKVLLEVLKEFVFPSTVIVCSCWKEQGCDDKEECQIFAEHYCFHFIDPVNDHQEQFFEQIWRQTGNRHHGTKEERLFKYRAEFEFSRIYSYAVRIETFYQLLAEFQENSIPSK